MGGGIGIGIGIGGKLVTWRARDTPVAGIGIGIGIGIGGNSGKWKAREKPGAGINIDISLGVAIVTRRGIALKSVVYGNCFGNFKCRRGIVNLVTRR